MSIFEKTLKAINKPKGAPEKTLAAIQRMRGHFLSGVRVPCMMYSGGKDSSVSQSMALVAWKMACDEMPRLKKVPFIIVSVNTLSEQPVKQSYLGDEFAACVQFAEENGFTLKIEKPMPTVGNRWAGKVVTGVYRNFSTETSRDHKCAVIWKIDPATRCLRKWESVIKDMGLRMLQIVGSRHDESQSRAESLDRFKANGYSIVPPSGAVKYDTIYPVYDFTKDDIWDYLLFAENETGAKFPAIKDGFDGTISLYNDLSGGECSFDQSGSSSCSGSRDGCWLCFASNAPMIDESLVKTNPHVSPLAEFRRFMLENDRNANLRNYIQTTMDKGKLFVKYNPNGLCGSYLLKILEIGLTIQQRELERAALVAKQLKEGTYINTGGKVLDKPTFEIFRPEDILFIDLQWGMRGMQLEPHAALKAYKRIVLDGERVDIPKGYVLDKPFSKNLDIQGKIFLGDVQVAENLELDDCHINDGGWDADIDLCKSILSKEVLEDWLSKETSFIGAIQRILDSGAITVPKSQIKAVNLRVENVKKIYSSGLNKTAYDGGTINYNDEKVA
ncbi:phosphoadenosine phosphosulfate reductase family protein [Vibrio sp. D431a]|uniref:phosphoadenosine phosphosulfate reductase domain-containing protein n=1 Tax=Vibrio sp. D431a TaxID=2837388 RepID=UPI0025563A1B|nr:phosphoadenosine phosphosulfate reductase family protein [Vibrio sp. D431a]MDK9790054.1 phosphoadenosine phosphosulfate reductase family protein [Vibrio sp. D431a]